MLDEKISSLKGEPRAVVRILSWPEPEAWSATYSGMSRAERLTVQREIARQIKGPVLDRIADVPGARVTNTLDGTLQAIVAATPEVWRVLLDPRDPIIPADRVTLAEDRFVPVA